MINIDQTTPNKDEYSFKNVDETINSFKLVEIDEEARQSTTRMKDRLRSEIKEAERREVNENTIDGFIEWVESKCDSMVRDSLVNLHRLQAIFQEMDRPGLYAHDPYTLIDEIKHIYPVLFGNIIMALQLRGVALDKIKTFVVNNTIDFDGMEEEKNKIEKAKKESDGLIEDLKKKLIEAGKTIDGFNSEVPQLKKKIDDLEKENYLYYEKAKLHGVELKDRQLPVMSPTTPAGYVDPLKLNGKERLVQEWKLRGWTEQDLMNGIDKGLTRKEIMAKTGVAGNTYSMFVREVKDGRLKWTIQ